MSDKEVDLSTIGPRPVTPKKEQPTEGSKTVKGDADDVLSFILSKSQDELLPWESITLPSQGLYYGSSIPGGVIKVRPMGLHTEKVFATPRLAQTGQALDEVYRRCVKFPDENFDPLDLLVGDRVYLLFALRGISHGNIYEYSVKCLNESCGVQFTQEFDLNNLSQTVKGPKHQTEPVKVRMAYLSEKTGRDVWAEMRFMRGRDLSVIGQKHKLVDRIIGNKKDRQVSIDQTIEEHLNLVVFSINGNSDHAKIAKVLQNLHARDSAALRGFLRDDAPGMDTEIDVECPDCGNKMQMELPITDTFFRPQNN